jgi:hypothetical protein
VLHFTSPVKVEAAASTWTSGAVTLRETLALTSTLTAVSLTVQPAAWRTVTSWAASSSTTSWPERILIRTLGPLAASSNSRRLWARERSSRRLLARWAACGSRAVPFQAAPTM